MEKPACLFCAIPREQILIDGPIAVAARDSYPVSKGHTLIIPRRHVASFFDTTEEERKSSANGHADAIGRVEMWRGGVRSNISVSRPFRLAVP